MQNLSANAEDLESAYTDQREINNLLLVVITSNRGLCGAFNSNIIKKTAHLINDVYADKNVAICAIGKKGRDILAKKFNIAASHNELYDDLTFNNASRIAEELMQLFVDGKYDKIEFVYNQFKNAATQLIQIEQFLPIVATASDNDTNINYIFEPNQKDIVTHLMPKSLKMQLYKAVRDSYASEHGARMIAMHKATDNANELRNDLLLTYNKARQASITNEILEIVSGAEALNN